MAVFRVNKTKDFTTMSNYHLKEKEMSLKAIGLLSIMLSLPDDWDYSVGGLTAIRKETKNTINETLKELEKFGYLVRTKKRNDKGIFTECVYDIYEKPFTKNRDMDNRDMENPYMDNLPQLNTKEVSTNISNTKEDNIPTPPIEDNIFDFIEKNFMRTLTPIELEKIKEWEDNELTRYVIKKAVLNQKYNIHYIDKVLYEMEKQNITTAQEAQQKDEEFQRNKSKPKYEKKETYSEKLDRWAREAEERERLEREENGSK